MMNNCNDYWTQNLSSSCMIEGHSTLLSILPLIAVGLILLLLINAGDIKK